MIQSNETNNWIVLKDHLENEDVFISSIPIIVPKKMTFGKMMENYPVQFKLYDDDGELYYSGRMQAEDFEPLDNFGIGSGCTTLKYRQGNDPWQII